MPYEPKSQSKTESIYFGYTFHKRYAALAFATLLEEPEWSVSLTFEPGRGCWLVVVKREMVALHQEIEASRRFLSERAARVDGQEDGWGKVTDDA